MNWIVITIGTALVLALTAALVGPYFVDWTLYRATIEANAERVLGTDVAIEGEADVRLLPRPHLRLTNVRLGDADAPLMEAARVEFDVDLAPLFSGQLSIRTLQLDQPTVYVRVNHDGGLELPDITRERRFGSLFDASDTKVEEVAVTDTRLVLRDARSGTTRTLENVSLTGNARSLRGPFTVNGTITAGGGAQEFRIAGGAMDASGAMPISARAALPALGASVALDATLSPAPAAPSLAGRLTLTGSGPLAWSIGGDLMLDPARVALARAQLSYGPADSPLELSGRAEYNLTQNEPLWVTLESRQIDLDRIDRTLAGSAGATPADPAASAGTAPQAPPREAVARLLAHLGPAFSGLSAVSGGGLPVSAQLDIGAIVAGGALVRDVSVEARTGLNGLTIERAEALLPGEALIDTNGVVRDGTYQGSLRMRAAQPASLVRWWTGEASAAGLIAPILVETDIDVSGGGMIAQRLSVRVGDSTANGRAQYHPSPDAATPSVIDVSLSAPLLNLTDVVSGAQILALADLSTQGGTDLLLDLAVDRLRLGSIEGSALNIDADYRDGTLTIDAFVADDIAGAEVFASGTISDLTGAPVGAIDGTLLLSDGNALAAGLAEVFPASETARRLAAIVPALAPGDVRFSLVGRPGERRQDLSLSLSGALGGTQLSVAASGVPFEGEWLTRPLSLEITASNPDAAALMRQVGLPAADLDQPSPGEFRFTASGEAVSGIDIDASLAAAGAHVGLDGTARFDGALRWEGRLESSAARLPAVGTLLGRALPDVGPVRLSGRLGTDADAGLALDDIRASVDGVRVSGRLTAASDGIGGALSTDTVNLLALAGLILGPDAFAASPDTPWPTAAFGPATLPDVPVSVAITANRMTIGATTLQDARFDLALAPDRLAIDELSGTIGGGAASGGVSLTRDALSASLAGRLALDGVSLANLVWQRDGRPVATGRLDLSAEAAATGHSVAGLVAGLSGDGTLSVADGRFIGLNPAPFPLPADAGEAVTPAEVIAHLDASDLTFGTLTGAFDINGGTVRLKDFALDRESAVALADASFDLGTWDLASAFALAVRSDAPDAARIGVRIAGPMESPARSVDVASLATWLSLRALEQQVQAVEEQNQELAAEADARDASLPGTPPAEAPAPADAAAPAATPGATPGASGPQEPFRLQSTPTEAAPADPQRGAALDDPAGDEIESLLGELSDTASAYEARRGTRERVSDELRRREGVSSAASAASGASPLRPQPFRVLPRDLEPAPAN
ncbi:AsmA family protein [Acuticoccus kandeliae]|uniref:AsmA family protein n=1 Tax=Acuticoccus kandeliae TaxID=2073160 RepID=UPI000D3E8DE6|nr:AsmA family protein [Acuticoccus kandeliae]